MAVAASSCRSQRGVSLVEALISIALLTVMLIAFLGLYDSSAKVAKSQGNISDATENLRFAIAELVRVTRMAGTGGLPMVYLDSGGSLQPLALEVYDNVDGSATHQYGSRTALAGTDVLRVRGAMRYDMNDIQGSAAGVIDLAGRTVKVSATSPFSGAAQILDYPDMTNGYPFLIGLQTPLDIRPSVGGVRHYNQYRIVQATAASIAGTEMTVTFDDTDPVTALNPGGTYTAFEESFAYSAGFVDDLVFFIARNDSGEPSLYRFAGGTALELVPNIANLQVALGCDLDRNGEIADAEWFRSLANDNDPTGDQFTAVRDVRLSLVARSQDREIGNWQEDATMPENSPQLSGDDLRYRYRVITVGVSLRSHPPLLDT